MAEVLRAYGWESGQNQINTGDSGTDGVPALTNVAARVKTGTYALTCPPSGWAHYLQAFVRWAIPGTPNDPSISVWIYPQSSSAYNLNDSWRISFRLDSGHYIEFRWNSTSKTLDGYVNNVLVAAGTVKVSVQDYFHVQIECLIANAGHLRVKINGHLSIDYSGDTMPGGTDAVLYFYESSAGAGGLYFDDLVIGRDGFLGDLRCIDLRPNGDTALVDWTPSAGDNYSTIDESNTNAGTIDADYNETNNDGAADELELTDFDGATYVPVAVTAWVRARMLAATGDSIDVGIDSGGTDDVTRHALSTTWQYYFHTADNNPADAAEWEDADLDALKLRYVSVIT